MGVGFLGAAALQTSYEVEPAELAWEELSPAHFDLRWAVPRYRGVPGRDLARELEDLAGAGAFGDLAHGVTDVPEAYRAPYLQNRTPEALSHRAEAVRELLLDARLLSADWDPTDDEPDDGFLQGESWPLAGEGAPWNDLRVDPVAEQGAVFVRCDLSTWKETENDFPRFHEDVGAEYEEVWPVDGTHFRGVDPDGGAFEAHAAFLRRDLPFPFGGYSFELELLARLDEQGRVVTQVYSTSDDFHWMAGRDVCLPVMTTEGRPVGLIVTRALGFDLDGVPDRGHHRVESIRGALGNLKRRAEALFRERGGEFGPLEGVLPDYPVRGDGERRTR